MKTEIRRAERMEKIATLAARRGLYWPKQILPDLRAPGTSKGALVCDAAREKPTEYSLSVILHSGRVSLTLGRYPLPHFDQGFGLGDRIEQAIRKILTEEQCESPDE